jgi:hypothetical protein
VKDLTLRASFNIRRPLETEEEAETPPKPNGDYGSARTVDASSTGTRDAPLARTALAATLFLEEHDADRSPEMLRLLVDDGNANGNDNGDYGSARTADASSTGTRDAPLARTALAATLFSQPQDNAKTTDVPKVLGKIRPDLLHAHSVLARVARPARGPARHSPGTSRPGPGSSATSTPPRIWAPTSSEARRSP